MLAVVAGLVLFISAPLRRVAHAGGRARTATSLAELEAAREAKYRELRDAELDHRTGKLSDEDYAELDASLRAEAIEILRGLDRERDRSLPSASSMTTILGVVQVFIWVVLVFLILMHSGKDSGLSGAFGVGTGAGPFGGGSTGRAQPEPLDDRVRGRVRDQHDRPDQDLLGAAFGGVPGARSAGRPCPAVAIHAEAP